MADDDVLVIGAGLSGLVAARTLDAAGVPTVLIDKSTGPGGRLATRAVDGALVDHGAQFFTVRGDDFAAMVEEWRALGVPVSEWSRGFAQATDVRDGPDGVTSTGGDGHPRYAVEGGMNTIAQVLAGGLDVRAPARAQAVWTSGGRWHVAVTTPHGETTLRARALISTPPLPGALALFVRGAVALPSALLARLRSVSYDPCLALMVVLDRRPPLPEPGGVQFAQGPVRWLADNARKSVSSTPAVTVHAASGWSTAALDDGDGDIAATLGAWLRPWLGDAEPTTVQLKRWRFSQPRSPITTAAPAARVDGAPLVFAGDAFTQSKVEGAARSGVAAAEALLGR